MVTTRDRAPARPESFPEPGLPVMTFGVVLVDAFFCIVRLVPVILVGSLVNVPGIKGDASIWLIPVLGLNALVSVTGIASAVALIRKLRVSLVMYVLSIILSVASLAVGWMLALNNTTPENHAVAIQMVLTAGTIVWCMILAAGLRRARCVFRLTDTPGWLTREELSYLPEVPGLRDLSLAKCAWLTDADCPPMGQLKGLVRLDLTRANIGDVGVLELCQLPKLQTLILDGTRVTDASLEYLAMLPSLRQISLAGSKCSEKGIREFTGWLAGKQVVDAELVPNRPPAAPAPPVAAAQTPADFAKGDDQAIAAFLSGGGKTPGP